MAIPPFPTNLWLYLQPGSKDLLQQELARRLTGQGVYQSRRYQRVPFSLSWIFSCSLVCKRAAPKNTAQKRRCCGDSVTLPHETKEVSRTVCKVPLPSLFVQERQKELFSPAVVQVHLLRLGAEPLQLYCHYVGSFAEVEKVLVVLTAPPTSKNPKPTYMNLLTILYTIYIYTR